MTNPPIDNLVQQLLDIIPPSFNALSDELERQFYKILKTAFLKMDMLTREEFDVQVNVLKRTRQKLEILEKTLADLEKNSTALTATSADVPSTQTQKKISKATKKEVGK